MDQIPGLNPAFHTLSSTRQASLSLRFGFPAEEQGEGQAMALWPMLIRRTSVSSEILPQISQQVSPV